MISSLHSIKCLWKAAKNRAQWAYPRPVHLPLQPAERFGACSSAQQGGYVNVGIFNNQLELSRGINLQIRKEDSREDYLFYYLLVEIFQ